MAEFADIILEEENQMLETYREFQERQSWLPLKERATSGRWFNKQKRAEELWNKATPVKPKPKPKKTPKSKAHMYPPTKKKTTNKVLKGMGLKPEGHWKKMFDRKKNKGKNGN